MSRNFWSERAQANITPGQYLAELMCERMAKTKGLPLVGKYWHQPEWQKVFRQQVRSASSLLRIYPVEAILSALNETTEGKKAYSLQASWLDPLIANRLAELRQRAAAEEATEPTLPPEPPLRPEKPRQSQKKSKSPSILSRLKELDHNGEES